MHCTFKVVLHPAVHSEMYLALHPALLPELLASLHAVLYAPSSIIEEAINRHSIYINSCKGRGYS